MTYTEETTLFACEGDTLLGILAKPETPAQTGMIVGELRHEKTNFET